MIQVLTEKYRPRKVDDLVFINDDYEKKKYEGNQTAGKKGIAGTCWNCDPWASGSVWSEYFRNNPFYQFIFWHIRAGSGSQ